MINAPYPTNNPLDEIIQEQFDRMFDTYDNFDDGGGDDDGVGGFLGDDVDDGLIDGDSWDNELDDGNFLNQLLRYTKAELLDGSVKGLANLETVKNSAKDNVYELSKGCTKILHHAPFQSWVVEFKG